LGRAKGCTVEGASGSQPLSATDLAQEFTPLKADSKIPDQKLESIDLKRWIRYVRAQQSLNNVKEMPRNLVVSPSNLLLRSLTEKRSAKISQLLLASLACSDDSSIEAYASQIFIDMKTDFQKTLESMAQKSEETLKIAQELGCLNAKKQDLKHWLSIALEMGGDNSFESIEPQFLKSRDKLYAYRSLRPFLDSLAQSR
jgi:hypothetical protein